MSKETPVDDPRQQTDWGSHKQTDKPWKGNPEKEQRPGGPKRDLEKWQESNIHWPTATPAGLSSATMRRFHFNLVDRDRVVAPTGHPIDGREQAIAVAKRLAIDLAETRQEYLGRGFAVAVVDDCETEIHRESIDGAEKSG
jgi:hypothetical protein